MVISVTHDWADGAVEAVESVETVVPPEVFNNNDTKEPIVFQSSRSIEELITNGPTDGNVEEEVRLDIT